MSLISRVPLDPRQVVRGLRIVWAAMLFSLLMYAVVLTQTHATSTTEPLQHNTQSGIAICGMMTAAIVLYVRFIRIPSLIPPLEPIDVKTMAQRAWANYLFCFGFSESTGLFGFVLAFTRGDPKFYRPLYLGGVLLMLLCYPRLPSNE